MGARYNIVLAADSPDPGIWVAVVSRLTPLIDNLIGVIQTVMIHNYTTDQVRESPLVGAPTSIPLISPDEIATLYAADVATGCVLLGHEGRFRTVTISAQATQDPLRSLQQTWSAAGDLVEVVAAGEELEVSEPDLDYMLDNARIPVSLDLCHQAIVRPSRKGKTEKKATLVEVEHGGILIQGHRRAPSGLP